MGPEHRHGSAKAGLAARLEDPRVDQRAIGAKRSSILFEFLLEAALLCLMGGAMGLLLVYILTVVFTKLLNFPVFVSIPLLLGTVVICLIVGVLAGIFPASRAAKMDAVEAIRSK